MFLIVAQNESGTNVYLRFDPDAARDFWFSSQTGEIHSTRDGAECELASAREWFADRMERDDCDTQWFGQVTCLLRAKVVEFRPA